MFRRLRPHYGRAYNEGRAGSFGGYGAAGHWENARRWERSARGVLSAMLTYSQADPSWWPGTLVDLGCGRGALVAELRKLGVKAFGLDIGGDFSHPHCVTGNAAEAPLADAFDTVLALDLVEHVPADLQSELLSELKRLTRRLLLVTVPTRPPHHWLDSQEEPRNHYLCVPPNGWRAHFRLHGLAVLAEGEALASLGHPCDHGADNYPFALRREIR